MPLTDGKTSDFTSITENNLQRVQNTVSKVGYSDGITAGRESVFQNGFDTGYKNGLATGFELAKYKAFYEVMKNHSSATDEIKNEANVHKEFELASPTDKEHFMNDGDEVSQISKRQLNYLNSKTNLFAKDLPLATSLFSRYRLTHI